MTKRSRERLPIAIVLLLFVVLVHVGGFLVIGFSTGKTLVLSMQSVMEPEVSQAQIFRGELVYPVTRMPDEDLMALRYVDLKTGKFRDAEFPEAYIDRGLVTDGKTLWAICGVGRIYETDGSTEKLYHTRRKLMSRPTLWNRAFLYEGAPAIVDYDAENVARLVVLIDHDWVDRGQIALPSVDHVWTFDKATGKPVLAPSMTTSSIGRLNNISVLPDGEKYHLLRLEPMPGDTAGQQIYRISHRVGFEFVVAPGDDEPASACLPMNAPAEATGWELLAVKIEMWNGCSAAQNGEMLLAGREDIRMASSGNIWKQVAHRDPADAQRFEKLLPTERLRAFEYSAGTIGLVTSPETNEIYAVVHSRLGDLDVYRLDGTQLVKLPYRIEGIVTPVVRQTGTVLFQVIAVLWIGTLLFVLGAAWLTNRTGLSSYSFGQEPVPLAPLMRRAVARVFDLMLILSPLLVHSAWRLSQMDAETLFVSFNRSLFRDLFVQGSFFPFLVWGGVTWVSLIAATSRWGVTPGKWLCQIRVFRTTLRPCGFTRALLRELMLWLDAPLLLTGIPAVISWLATDFRQRIGDLVADTIVIDVRARTVLSSAIET